MADCHLFGLNAAGHHFTSVFLHSLNVLVLYATLRLFTSDLWKCFLVSSLFAIHPIGADSVAWIGERKNVLSSFFWITTLWLYCNYVKKKSLKKYALILCTFVLGLLSKSMLVSLPFLLLLLDYWPLRRFSIPHSHTDIQIDSDADNPEKIPILSKSSWEPLMEKIPFFILSAASVYLSIISIEAYDPTISLTKVPMSLRIENSFISYWIYIKKLIFPLDLAIYYPFPESIPLTYAILAGIGLFIFSIFVILFATRAPYLLVGWFWYVGTLFPVIGIHQHGLWPALADRWAYIPAIGLYIAGTWGGGNLISRFPYSEYIKWILTSFIILLYFIFAIHQVKHWKNSTTIFDHTCRVTENNYRIHNLLGREYQKQGNFTLARKHYLEALKIKPDYVYTHVNLGLLNFEEGNVQDAVQRFKKMLSTDRSNPQAYCNLGNDTSKIRRLPSSENESISGFNSQARFSCCPL